MVIGLTLELVLQDLWRDQMRRLVKVLREIRELSGRFQ